MLVPLWPALRAYSKKMLFFGHSINSPSLFLFSDSIIKQKSFPQVRGDKSSSSYPQGKKTIHIVHKSYPQVVNKKKKPSQIKGGQPFYDVDKFVSFFSSIHRSNKLVDNSVKIFFRRKVDLNSSRVIL